MAKGIYCPFYIRHTNFFVLCEDMRFMSFDTKADCKEFVKKHCGHKTEWKQCTWAKEFLMHYGEEIDE